MEISGNNNFDSIISEFSPVVQSSLKMLLQSQTPPGYFHMTGSDAAICIYETAAFRRTVIFKNATGVPEKRYDFLYFPEYNPIVKKDGRYRLICEAVDDESDTAFIVAIDFDDIEISDEVFRANDRIFMPLEQFFDGSPWLYLITVSTDILLKSCLSEKYLNQKEKELLPLLSEISYLGYESGRVMKRSKIEEVESLELLQLKKYAEKFGYNKILSAIEKLEAEWAKKNKREKNAKSLVSELDKIAYEPLWREIYGKILDSQAEHPSKAETHCSADMLNKIRADVQKMMEEYGYEGTYPDFIKKGALHGIHLADSYNLTYFVGMEKDVVYHIHCTEEWFDGRFEIEFLCGTAMLKKHEEYNDIYSCVFDAKGRRLFSTVTFENQYISCDGEKKGDSLEERVRIAVKKAELKKLTKEERKSLIGNYPWWILFFSVFVIMGGLFAVFMTLGMLLISIITCVISGEVTAIPEMITTVPWWIVFVLAWALFGGAMGIVTVLAKRK